jgi:prepilin-type N-terminal cleavage/methylation domain-containing protein
MLSFDRHCRKTRGYSLLELLIVVAILVLLLGLSVPALRKASRKSQLLDAARQLRVTLLKARLGAIESGRPVLFCYRGGSGEYEISAADNAGFAGQERGVPWLDGGQGAVTAGRSTGKPREQHGLPSGVRFAEQDSWQSLTSESTASRFDVVAAWSDPIVFFPNGRTTNAHLRLTNPHYWVDLTVRGLTGSVRIGPVQRVEAKAANLTARAAQDLP